MHRSRRCGALDRLGQRAPQGLGGAEPLQPAQRGEGVAGDQAQVELLGEGERLQGGGLRLLEPAVRRQDPGVGGEHAGAHTRRPRWQQPHRLGGDGARILVGLGRDHRLRPGGEQARPPVGGSVGRQPGQLLRQQGVRPHRVPAGQQRLGGVDQQLRQVEVGRSAAGVGEQLQGLLEVPGRLVRTTDGHRLPAGADAGVDRGLVVHRQPGVPGQLGRRPTGPPLAQGVGVRGVQPDPLTGQQVVVGRLGEQGVPERVRRLLGDQDVGLHRLPQRFLQRRLGHPRHRRQLRVAHPATGHAGGPDHLPGGLVEPVDPGQQHPDQVGRQPAVGAGRDAHQLLDEERVALGPRDDLGQLVLGHRVGMERGDQLAHGAVLERLQVQPLDAAEA